MDEIRPIGAHEPDGPGLGVIVKDGIDEGHSPTPSRHGDFDTPRAIHDLDVLTWADDDLAFKNYLALGKRLASTGDIFRMSQHGGGLLLASNNPLVPPETITRATDLARRLSERVRVLVEKNGKTIGMRISSTHLNDMLGSEVFLQCFRPLDAVTSTALYLPDVSLTLPGYNDGGPGFRYFFRGESPIISESHETIDRFLDAMCFASASDRTNAVAAALTVQFHNLLPGAKPAIVVTADKSHAGKGTIVAFAAGSHKTSCISYQVTDWALERSFVGALRVSPESVVLHVDNARLSRGDRFIASAFLERFITDPEPTLFSTGTGPPTRIRNDKIVAITTNFGTLSEDLMNRSLPIHLTPVGNVADRRSAIGNPKDEFLPAHKRQIESELLGMVEKWKVAGRPLDDRVRHPFSGWAAIVGGILLVNGYQDFLDNYNARKTADDPIRKALGLLGAAQPDEWLRPGEWVNHAARFGLTDVLIPPANRDSVESRERSIGELLSAREEETFDAETENEQLCMQLQKKRRRFDGEPQTRYRFVVLSRSEIPESE